MGAGCSSDRSGDVKSMGDVPNFKIVLVGDPGVGKTSIFLRYYKNQFDYDYTPTEKVVIENVVKKLNIPENTVVSVTMWDVPGREDMDLRKTYYRDLDGVIVVVDMNDMDSIELATAWKQDVLSNATITKPVREKTSTGEEVVVIQESPMSPDAVPLLLLGNKYDLVEEKLLQEKMNKEKQVTIQEPQEEENDEENLKDKNEQKDEEIDKGDEDDEEKQDASKDEQIDGETGDQQSGDKSKDLVDGEKSEQVEEDVEEKSESRHHHHHHEENDKEKEMEIENNKDKEEKDEASHPTASFEQKQKEWEAERLRAVARGLYGEEDDDDVEKPESVLLLEKVAADSGFIASVTVSAKDSNGSVHSAIQSFVRHLIEKKLENRIKSKRDKKREKEEKEKEKKKKKEKKKPDGFKPLDECGMAEFDELFNRCNVPIRKAGDYSAYYDIALRKFKCACIDYELIKVPGDDENKCSLEDCILGLKQNIGCGDDLHAEDDEEGFLKLVIENEKKIKPTRAVKNTLETFHTEYALICKAILKEGPYMKNVLQKLDDKISTQSEQAWDIMNEVGNGKKDVRQVMTVVDRNRARLERALMQANENLSNVENAYAKIKAALMW